MADLFERLAYQPVRSTAPGNVPSIDMAAGREAARTGQALTQAMDRIAGFASKRAVQGQTLRGQMEGAADPRSTLLGLEDRDPGTFNIKEAAAYEAAVKGLSAQVEVEAKKTMGEIILDSTQKGEAPEKLGERLDMAVTGFADSLALMDPGTAETLRLQLHDYRNAQYLNFSQDYFKEQRRINKAEGTLGLDTMNKSLEDLARSSLPDAEMDKMITSQLDSMGDFLRSKGFNDQEIADERLRSQKRAVVARARGAFARLGDDAAAQAQFAEDFREDIAKGKGLARGMSDAVAETLANSFDATAKASGNALNGEIALLNADIKIDVTSLVRQGGVVSDGVIEKLKGRISSLEEKGADKEKIAELKEALSTAEGNIDYFQGIQGYNIEQLEAEETRLQQIKDTQATPDDTLRLKVVKSRLANAESEARANNLKWGTAATQVGKQVDALIKVVERFDTVRDEDIQAIKDGIQAIKDDGAPDELIAALNQDLALMEGLVGVYNEFKDDSPLALEREISKFNQKEGGLSPAESELLDGMKKRLTAMRTALGKDAMNWANGAGVVTIQADVVETVFGGNKTDVSTAVQGRISDANKVAQHYGIPRQILTRAEASAMATAINEAPVEQQAFLIGKIVDGFGSNALDVLKQVSKDAPDLAHIGGMLVNGSDASTIDAALRGRIIKEGTEERALGEMTDQRSKRVKIMDGMQIGSPAMSRTVDRLTSVADLIYLGMGGSSGGVFNDDLYEEALQLAAGRNERDGVMYGGITKYKGRNIFVPDNIETDGGVKEVMRGLETIEDLAALAVQGDGKGGYTPINVGPIGELNFEFLTIGRVKDLALISVHDGIYQLVDKEGRLAQAPGGQPYLIDLKRVQ